MKCTTCGHENRLGVKFCESCGNPMPHVQAPQPAGRFCPNCGQVQSPGNKFCQNCGTAIGEEPAQTGPVPVSSPTEAPVYAVPPPRRKGLRGCIWPFIGFFSGLFFICSLMFYLTWIRIPAIPHSPSTPVVIVKTVHTLRIVQANLSPPAAATDLGDKLYPRVSPPLKDRVQVVIDDDPGGTKIVRTLPNPAACGPELSLKDPEITRRQTFFLQEAAGAGPLIYDFENTGDSLSNVEYEYRAQWVMTSSETGEKVNETKSCWVTDGHLFCYGPDTDAYSYAEMRIYSENPACGSPVASFPFDGVDPAPAEDEAWECHSPDEITDIYPNASNVFGDDIELLPDSTLWRIRFNPDYFSTTPYIGGDIPYRLKTEAYDPDLKQWRSFDGVCWSYTTWLFDCMGWDPEKFPSIRWALMSEPVDKCIEPMASGMSGSIVAEEPEPQVCVPEEIKSKLPSFQLKMIGRDSGWDPNFDNPFAVHLPSGISDADMKSLSDHLYVVYEIRNPDGTIWGENNVFGCNEPNLYAIPCGYAIYEHGQFVKDDQSVTMQVFYREYQKCEELMLEKHWPALQVAQPPAPPDRCDLFDEKNMKVTYLDWMPGAPLQFNIKMPGGVPGLEKEIPGDNGDWEYSVKIGDATTSNCDILAGYKERLYCTISLPKEYSATSVYSLSLNVNGCDDVYSNKAYLPGFAEVPGGGGGGDEEEEPNSCPAGQAYYGPTAWWGGGCCSDGHWYIFSGDTEPGCWN